MNLKKTVSAAAIAVGFSVLGLCVAGVADAALSPAIPGTPLPQDDIWWWVPGYGPVHQGDETSVWYGPALDTTNGTVVWPVPYGPGLPVPEVAAPALPTLPTLPTVPGVTLPTLPTLPTVPGVTLPTLPTLPTVPTISLPSL